jgi:hypothetical protein
MKCREVRDWGRFAVMCRCRFILIGIGLSLVLAALSDPASGQEYVWAESQAAPSGDEGFRDYWKYVLSIGWDVSEYSAPPHAMSHISVLLGLETCLSTCEDIYFAFPDTVGMGQGEGPCKVYYYVELDCRGDPTIPDEVPTIKFEPYPSVCEPDIAGTISVCFYSLAPPDTVGTMPAYVWMKFGPHIERGRLEGVLPKCLGRPAGTEASTWGTIKSFYDE